MINKYACLKNDNTIPEAEAIKYEISNLFSLQIRNADKTLPDYLNKANHTKKCRNKLLQKQIIHVQTSHFVMLS